MKNKLYMLAFMFGLAAVLGGAAILKRMGVPVRLGDVAIVQAAGPAANGPLSGSSGTGFSVDWYTIDSGGGDTGGNGYQLMAAIGQPAAETSTGGAFQLQGGFLQGVLQPWHGYLPLQKK